MLNLLLKKNEIECINILGSVIYELDTSIPFIETNILNNKSTIKHNINYLNKIFVLLDHTDIKIRINNNQIILDGAYQDIHDNLLFDVSSYLILNSATYKVFSALLTTSNPTHKFIQEHAHISSSYLAKIVREVNQTLEKTSLRVISRKQQLFVVGSNINKLYFDFMLRCFLSFLSPTDAVKKNIANFDTSIFHSASSDFNLEKSKCLYTAFEHSAKKEKAAYIKNAEILHILNSLISINDLVLKIQSNGKPINQERYLFNLFLRLATGEADNFEQRQEFSKQLLAYHLEQPHNQLISDIIKVGKKFQRYSQKNDDDNVILFEAIYLITLKQITANLLECNIDELFDFTPYFISNSPLMNDENRSIQNFTDSLKIDSELSDETKKMVSMYQKQLNGDLFTLIPKKKRPLKIAVDMSYQLSREYYLKQLILDLFTADSIEFSSKKEESDIIISDHIVHTQPDTSLFFLLDTNSSESIELLLSFITKKYLAKNRTNQRTISEMN